MKEEKKDQIETSAEYLANMCLENSNTYFCHEDKHLMNATLIFIHFFMDKIYSENRHLSEDKMKDLAETTGQALRELIKTSCGKDMHDIAKNPATYNKVEEE